MWGPSWCNKTTWVVALIITLMGTNYCRVISCGISIVTAVPHCDFDKKVSWNTPSPAKDTTKVIFIWYVRIGFDNISHTCHTSSPPSVIIILDSEPTDRSTTHTFLIRRTHAGPNVCTSVLTQLENLYPAPKEHRKGLPSFFSALQSKTSTRNSLAFLTSLSLSTLTYPYRLYKAYKPPLNTPYKKKTDN